MLRSLISSFNVMARVRNELVYPIEGPAVLGPVVAHVTADDPDKARMAADAVARCMAPAADVQIEGWLVMLQAACARRSGSDATAAATYALYAAELRKYPADVARAACERLMRGTPGAGVNWFPTLAEVIDACEGLVAPRRAIHEALRNWKPAIAAPLREAKAPKPDREAVRRMLSDYLASHEELKAERPNKPTFTPPQGKVDETGITPEMRDLIGRRQG